MKQKWHESRWEPALDWSTDAGSLLTRCVEILKGSLDAPPAELIVFGSTPLQMGISPALASGDVDIATRENIVSVLRANRLLKGQSAPYVEVCEPEDFVASTDWQSRAHREECQGIVLIFPHPIDILVSKVKRCEEKDMRAFEEVIRKTGHPTEPELIESLQRMVDIYRPTFDEERGTDPVANTRMLWERLYGREIDVRAEIITPAASRRSHAGHSAAADSAKRALGNQGNSG
jgi:hypothetical protein